MVKQSQSPQGPDLLTERLQDVDGDLRGAVERLIGLRWADCMYGHIPDGYSDATICLSDQRIRMFRQHPFTNFVFRQDRLGRFWLGDFHRSALFAALMLHSSFLKGRAQPVKLADLARMSGLSVTFVRQLLKLAAATGDFRRERHSGDARLLVFEPSPEIVQFATEFCEQRISAAMLLCERDAPRLPPSGGQNELYRLSIGMLASMVSEFGQQDRGVDRKTFLFSMWDLLSDGPSLPAEFVRQQVDRLHVTPKTVRLVIARAREMGWVAPGLPLVATDMARQRICASIDVLRARFNLLLDILEKAGGPELIAHR